MFQKITWFVLAFLAIGGTYDLARAPSTFGPKTPSSLVMGVNSVEVAFRAVTTFVSILNNSVDTPILVDVVKQTGLPGSAFGAGTVTKGTYQALRLTLSGTGTYSGIDPCTLTEVTDAGIQLPGGESGKVVIREMVPHPVTGLQSGFKSMKPFDVGSTPTEFRLVYPASNSVVCSSSAAPLRTISGVGLNKPEGIALDQSHNEIAVSNNNTNTVEVFNSNGEGVLPPYRSITGDKSGLSNPIGLYIDTDNDEMGVANSGNDSITFYDRNFLATGDIAPKRTLIGDATQLKGPSGIALDITHDEIVVTNGGNNSVTIYNRQAILDKTDPMTYIANVDPLRAISGSDTGLNAPCGIYVDKDNDEIGVSNNGNSSVTVYDRSADGNIAPKRTISGADTGLSNPCGIYVDTVHNEIGVANSGQDSIVIYDRMASGDVAPKRTIKGDPTGISHPVGIYVDTNHDEIGLTDWGNDSLTFHKLDDPSVQLKDLPTLLISPLQQVLYPQYFYTGKIDNATGEGDPTSINYDGYNFVWKITDDRLRQAGDASPAGLIPPSNVVFELTDHSLVSTLALDCPRFTPFTIVQFSTNCSPPRILSPTPVRAGEYTIPGVVLKEILINQFTIAPSPLTTTDFPRPVLTVRLSEVNDVHKRAIEKIEWTYMNEPPIIASQSLQVSLTQTIATVNPGCYRQVQGNTQNLVFSSSLLTPDVRSIPNDTNTEDVKNNGCDIFMEDIGNISFTIKDAFETLYNFTWKPS